MVARVYGTADGVDITLEHIDGDLWQTAIPVNAQGRCVVEIWAEDEAGNKAYAATLLFLASGHEMRCYLVPRGFSGSIKDLEYAAEVNPAAILTQVLQGGGYAAQISEGGYTVECKLCG